MKGLCQRFTKAGAPRAAWDGTSRRQARRSGPGAGLSPRDKQFPPAQI